MPSSLSRILPIALLLALSAPRSALAESSAECPAPSLFVAKDVIGVEGAFDDLSAKLYAETDGGRVEAPVEIVPSDEPACYFKARKGFRVLAKEPLRGGESYVLEAQPRWVDCSPGRGATLLRFTAVDTVVLPTELPLPAPELLVRRCPSRPDYYSFDVDAPSLSTARDVRLRLSVDKKLHYCEGEGTHGEACTPGGQQVRSMHWVAEVPHTGQRFDGPLAQVVFACDSARVVPCPETFVPDAGTRVQDASARNRSDASAPAASSIGSRDGGSGCSLAPHPKVNHGLLCLLLLLLARNLAHLQRSRRP